MNNNYTVIHSKDPWLLARLSTDLMMEGINDDRGWNMRESEYCDKWNWNFFIIENNLFSLFTHSIYGIHLSLTESNYLQVLTTIIERHGK